MKVAFLTSYNSDLIKKDFDNYLLNKNCRIECWWNSFNTHEQSVFDYASAFYKFHADIVFIHYEVDSLLGNFISNPLHLEDINRKKVLENAKKEIRFIVNTVSKNLPASKIVIENFIARSPVSLGILDLNIPSSVTEIILSLNQFLFELKNELEDKLIIHDYAGIISLCGKNNVFDLRMFRLAKYPFTSSFSHYLFEHFYSLIDVFIKPRKKCIVLDLDNTLWGGIVGQDEFDNLQIGTSALGESFVEFQKLILNYYHRGIFLAICSKNNYEDAIEVIENHPDMVLRKRHFSSIKINWRNKADNLKEIAADLNIGTDSIVFLDDNPVECELIKQQLAEVEVINLTGDPDNYSSQILQVNSLNALSLTDEDRNRTLMFAADEKRKDYESSFSNLEDFYKSLQMNAFISINNPFHLSRIFQLTERTNQFNLTSRRYSSEEIKHLINDLSHRIYTLRLSDKFGDNGIVLAAIVKMNIIEWFIDAFMMSCRVIGRQAETALLNAILEDAQKGNIKHVKGEFISTKKNSPAADFYSRHNFQMLNNTEWIINLPTKLQTHFIKIHTGTHEN